MEAQQAGVTGKQILDNLEQRKLVFRGGGQRYRTRFADTVRALFLLRQRFSVDDWQTGDRLVGDMKLLLQRRRFPKREVTAGDLFAQLAPLELKPILMAAIHALLQERGGELTLARFQAQSVVRILRNLRTSADNAVVIGAGTGAGKTKSFYIPALAAIAGELSDENWVQALAIYPRKELLKDQLRETFTEARKLDRLLREQGKRPIRVGAYYGDVPRTAADVLQRRSENWRRTRDRTGYICPYVVCPDCGEQTMVWSQADLELEKEDNQQTIYGRYARLTCQDCRALVDSTTILLTRQQMVQQPPDILFTTTEMLNRRLSHAGERHLFGVGATRPARLVLMDEIHLNEGIHGAQVAYLLRRWRYLRRQQTQQGVCIVGLSATLTQADIFFARLTGICVAHVVYISSADGELVKEGLEYNVVLKGDPVSGTTLLSTSVRTAMLICRILDPLQAGAEVGVSGGAYGQRVFAFSDKLDVINRWYHIEREVENPVKPYSQYLWVDRTASDAQARYEQGQNWYFVPMIHNDPTILTSGLRLDITSSQYGGVDNRANLIIASSTLEVGYNDPTVGAIIQHKTPYTRAAFIQRKGRAGRTRSMRPWTMLITSAYGHDRWAFQHAEQLFDPLLPALDLPLENYYVQKIQATFALLDWLVSQFESTYPKVDVWRLLSSHKSARDPALDPPRRRLAMILLHLLEDEALRASFKQYLIAALDLGERASYIADTLLWGEPRPLILEVIPTALRQLETNWQRTMEGESG
ncbi:MAG: protein DpdJ, partial [Caldilinea sp.]|nr:protein DpdJ [Caldilinea sp.]